MTALDVDVNAPSGARAEAVQQYPADAERRRLKRLWPGEFADGEHCGFHQRYEGERAKGGYPLGFHGWPLDRRNAWYCGFNFGRIERRRAIAERADG